MKIHRLFILFSLLTAPLSADSTQNENDPNKREGYNVAILGDSRGEVEDTDGFNRYILSKLFKSISRHNTKAVFFTGDLILGLSDSKAAQPSPENAVVPAPERDLYDNRWRKKGLVYSTKTFTQELDSFSKLLQASLGKEPFFPLPGYFESLGPDSLKIFTEHFSIKNGVIIGNCLVYTVVVGNAYFILVSSDYYDNTAKKVLEHQITPPVLEWLKNDLKAKSQIYPFIFVLGHEPAFSTTNVSGEYKGYDNNAELRDQFWRILQDNNVLAYISSHEHLYDRTDRGGVWQIISGGAGAMLTPRNLEKAFYHYLLLNIPVDTDNDPVISVMDANGLIRDQFELKSMRKPIYQIRISENQ